jgi:large repetitive protein
MNLRSVRHRIGVGIVLTGLAVGMLAHPAAAAGLPVAVDDATYNPSWNYPYFSVLNVLGNDTWTGTATPSLVTNGANGTFVLNPGGTFNYTPNPGFVGTDSFTYQITDNAGTSNVATVSLILDYEPVGNPDGYTTPFETPITIPAPGVLANDTDADGPVLTATLTSLPSNGQITWSAGLDGSFTYTPNPGFQGVDQFTYLPGDGHFTGNTTSVEIDVDAPPNLAPTGVKDSYSTTAGTPLTVNASGVLANDTDPENDALEATQVTGPNHGTGDIQPDGTLTYTPDPGYVGTDFMYYYPYDGANTGFETEVEITVMPANTPTPEPTDAPGGETATPTPTDTTGDETATPPTDSSGDESPTPVATDTPDVPTSSDNPTPAPPVTTQDPGSEVGGVTTLPITGAGTSHQSGDSILWVALAFLGLGGISGGIRRKVNSKRR